MPATDLDPAPETVDRLLEAVDAQTSVEQPPGVRPETVRLALAAHGSMTPTQVDAAIQAAIDADEVLLWRDGGGELRVTRREEGSLRRLLGHFNREAFDASACERVAEAIQEVSR